MSGEDAAAKRDAMARAGSCDTVRRGKSVLQILP